MPRRGLVGEERVGRKCDAAGVSTAERVERIPPLEAFLPAGAGAAAQRVAGVGALAGLLAASVVLAAGATGQRLDFAVLAAVLALHVVFFLAPPMFSADVFGYIGYARLDELYGLDPYAHGAAAAPGDATAPFVRWHDIPSPYGPLFTAIGSPLAHVSVPLALWIWKAVAVLAGLACAALTWRVARQAGRDPLPATLFVGLNPLL